MPSINCLLIYYLHELSLGYLYITDQAVEHRTNHEHLGGHYTGSFQSESISQKRQSNITHEEWKRRRSPMESKVAEHFFRCWARTRGKKKESNKREREREVFTEEARDWTGTMMWKGLNWTNDVKTVFFFSPHSRHRRNFQIWQRFWRRICPIGCVFFHFQHGQWSTSQRRLKSIRTAENFISSTSKDLCCWVRESILHTSFSVCKSTTTAAGGASDEEEETSEEAALPVPNMLAGNHRSLAIIARWARGGWVCGREEGYRCSSRQKKGKHKTFVGWMGERSSDDDDDGQHQQLPREVGCLYCLYCKGWTLNWTRLSYHGRWTWLD